MKYHGFTLIELMVTLAIAAIVLTIGVPSFQSVIRNNQLTTRINSLVGAINLARSEAIKRDATDAATAPRPRRVAICAKAASTNTCVSAGGKTDWSNGWMVFLSYNASDLNITTPNTDILRIYDAIPSGYTLKAASNFVAYDNTGTSRTLNSPSSNASNVAFALCYGSTTTYSRELTVASVGRAQVKTGNPNTASICTP